MTISALKVTHAGVGFHASTVRQKLTAEAQPTFILYLIPLTHLAVIFAKTNAKS